MRRALILALILLTVGATMAAGWRLDMASRVTTRHVFYSIPYSISRLYFGSHGYVILGDIADVFLDAHPHVTNETLRRSLSIHPRPDRLMLFPADDKGDADFVTLSFLIFGLNLEGLYYTWFLLFVVSIAIFVATFWRDASRLAAVCVLLLAIYVGFFALPLTNELFSIHNPRSFGIVSLVAVLHLSFAMIDRQRLSRARLAAAAAQATFIAFSIHVRTTEFWQVMALVGLAAVLWIRDHSRDGVRALWPVAMALAAVFGLELYQRASFDRVYASTHVQHRIVWHNVGIGFALNPYLAKKYDLMIDDMPMIQLVRRRLVETNRASELNDVFRPAGQEDYKYNGIAKDYVRYEQLARDVVLSIMWHNKLQAVETFVVEKPRVLFRQLAWAAGYGGYTTDDLYLTGQAVALATDQARQDKGIYLSLFSPLPWAGVIAAVCLGGVRRAREYVVLSGLALSMCAASLLPALVAYPIISALGVALVTVPFFCLSILALIVQTAVARISKPPIVEATAPV
jgi:hypothetical protein